MNSLVSHQSVAHERLVQGLLYQNWTCVRDDCFSPVSLTIVTYVYPGVCTLWDGLLFAVHLNVGCVHLLSVGLLPFLLSGMGLRSLTMCPWSTPAGGRCLSPDQFYCSSPCLSTISSFTLQQAQLYPHLNRHC